MEEKRGPEQLFEEWTGQQNNNSQTVADEWEIRHN